MTTLVTKSGDAELRRPPLLLHVFFSFGAGGAQTRFIDIANHFGQALRHVVVALNDDYRSLAQIGPDVMVKSVPVERSRRNMPSRLREYAAVLSAVRPDHLVTHNWGSIEWALANRACGIHHIHMEDGFGPDEAARQKSRRVFVRRILLGGSNVVVPSKGLYRAAMERWKIPRGKLHYIPNGIDCDKFANPAGSIFPTQSSPVIGAVAALRPEKNLTRLLQAFALVNRELPCKLVIVGDGSERSQLEQLAAKLGIADQVDFAGHIANPAPFYWTFDLFSLTSDTEQMPYTVLEAMAAGLPVVATNVGDIRGMVAKENAPLIVDCSTESIAGALLSVLKDAHFARRLSEANVQKVRRDYDRRAMFEAFGRLYGVAGIETQ